MFDIEAEPGPKSTFSTYVAEGDKLFHNGDYTKAVESYSSALLLQPDNRDCLVARSKCHVKMGNAESALKDAEASLKQDKEFFKGLYQKAEALYTMGNFEFALVFYHRGHKLRPELQEFRLGIQKAQEAISNSVGSPSSVKLDNKSTSVSPFCNQSDEVEAKPLICPLQKDMKQQSQKTRRSEKTAKQLLGDLYTDKEYLEKLLKDGDLIKGRTRTGERLQDVILGCISYLDTRTEFWRQQKPMYARQRDRTLMAQQWKRTRHQAPSDPSYILKNLEKIDAALTAGNTRSALKKAREVLKTAKGWTEESLPDKSDVLGHLYSYIGNALMDLGDMNASLDNHIKDLQLAKEYNLIENKSRALDNIGRVYARIGKFQLAIEASHCASVEKSATDSVQTVRVSGPDGTLLIVDNSGPCLNSWEEKIPLLQDGLEQAWLFHEIGRCYLELKLHTEALDYGTRSLSAADDIADEKWQLNASVLVAQAELQLGHFEASVLHFERALDRAKLLQDDAARDAIQKALQETRQRVTL